MRTHLHTRHDHGSAQSSEETTSCKRQLTSHLCVATRVATHAPHGPTDAHTAQIAHRTIAPSTRLRLPPTGTASHLPGLQLAHHEQPPMGPLALDPSDPSRSVCAACITWQGQPQLVWSARPLPSLLQRLRQAQHSARSVALRGSSGAQLLSRMGSPADRLRVRPRSRLAGAVGARARRRRRARVARRAHFLAALIISSALMPIRSVRRHASK
jgi:hypothetical protein